MSEVGEVQCEAAAILVAGGFNRFNIRTVLVGHNDDADDGDGNDDGDGGGDIMLVVM